MPHSIWKGHISFGLVNIPVVLYSATKSNDMHFSLLEDKNLGKIRYERINEDTGKEVPWESIVKGYEYEEGQYVVVTKEDFDSIASENLKVIEIEDFVPKSAIDFEYFETPYYLVPDKRGDKGYVLLREVLNSTKKIGIARVMIRSRQYLAAILPYQESIILNVLRYDHELKKPKDFELPSENVSNYKISKKELDVAKQLVESMSTSWKPKKYKDEYYQQLQKLIDEKIASGGKAKHKHHEIIAPRKSNVVDFMELLKKSVKEKKKPSKEVKSKKSVKSKEKRKPAKKRQTK